MGLDGPDLTRRTILNFAIQYFLNLHFWFRKSDCRL